MQKPIMNPPAKPVPRFVPTLTEVVNADQLTLTTATTKSEQDEIIDLVQLQIQPQIERRLREQSDHLAQMFSAMQWTEVSAKLRQDIAELVRQAVLDALNPAQKIQTPPAPKIDS